MASLMFASHSEFPLSQTSCLDFTSELFGCPRAGHWQRGKMGHSAEMNYDSSWNGALLPSQVSVLLARTGGSRGGKSVCCGDPALFEGHSHWDAGRGGVNLEVGMGGSMPVQAPSASTLCAGCTSCLSSKVCLDPPFPMKESEASLAALLYGLRTSSQLAGSTHFLRYLLMLLCVSR